MKTLLTLATALWLTALGNAQADQVVVVELYTSQGCSSCPPADKILGELAQRDDVIALALHVDYWDYLGWKDKFASPRNTKRQRAYARAAGERTIYTPQMVIGGKDHVIGSRPMKISEALRKHARRDPAVNVSMKRNGNQVVIKATPNGRIGNGAVVQLVTYQPSETVKIRRGENAGRSITYHNIVQDWERVGTWNGSGTYSYTANVPAGTPVVCLVQNGDSGAILGAARLR